MVHLRAGAHCAALLALALPARGDVPVPPPAASAGDQGLVGRSPIVPLADPSLSKRIAEAPGQAWACTVTALADGRPCLLEGARGTSAPVPQRRDEEAGDIRDALCAKAAPDKVRSLCELLIDTGAASCGSARRTSLLDEQGRFRADTGTCVTALRDAISTLSTLLESDAACCSCLMRAGSAPAGDLGQCLEGVAVGTPPAGLGERRQCDESCAALLLRQPAPAARPTPPTTTETP
jgi:hypothetical protein